MHSRGIRFLLLWCCIFPTFADDPLALAWQFERPLAFPSTGTSGGAFNSLHLHHPQTLTFIYQSGADPVVIDRLISTGNPIWVRQFQALTNSGFRLRKTAVTSSGNVILAGHRESTGIGDTAEDLYVIQLDSSGNELWRHRFVDAQDPPDFAHDLLLDPDNNIYVGASKSFEFFIAKLSPAGSVLWETNSPPSSGNPVSGAYALALHPNGSLYAVDRDRLLRLTPSGEILWEKPTGMIQDTIRVGSSGALFLSLRQPFFNNDPQQVGKFDEFGNNLWISSGGDDFEVLPDERVIRASQGIIVEKADGSGLEDVVYGLVDSVSQILQRADHRLFLSARNGFLELRPDLSRVAFYPEASNRSIQEFHPPIIASDGTNLYRAGIYLATNDTLWAELRAWAPTNSIALPRILEHPVGATILAGENFTTTVRAAETPPGFELSYQWYEWLWDSLYAIEGATNTTLQFANLQSWYIGPPRPRTFSVRISNSLGTIYSREADLWVHVRPNLTNPPVPTPSLAYAGERVEWRIATTATAPLLIQWHKDSVPIPGANSYTYSITNLGPEHLGHYNVSISNAVGQSTSPAVAFTNLLTNASLEDIATLPGPALPLPLLQNDGAGNIVAVNSRSAGNGFEMVVSKFDSDGLLLWTTNANFLGNSQTGSPSDVPQALAINAAGELFLAGSSPGESTPRKPAILHLSPDGDLLGQIAVTGRVTRISNISIGRSGDIFVGGVLQDGGAYYVLLCLTQSGEQKWSARIPATVPYFSMHWIAPMQFDANENIIVTAPSRRILYSFTPDGATNWTASLGSFTPFDLESAPDGSFYLSGISSNRPALVRITAEGDVSPIQPLPHVSSAIFTDLQIDPDGALYYLSAASPSVGPPPTVSRLNTNATPIWSASFYSEVKPAFTLAGPEAIYAAGSHSSRAAETGLMKFDSDGVRRWTRRLSFPQQAVLAAASDSVVFTAIPFPGGHVPLLRVEDLESVEVRSQSAQIIQHLLNNWLHLEARAIESDLLRVRWIRPGVSPSSLDTAALRQIPFPSNPFITWSAEVTTPEAVLVTPDFFPTAFAHLLTPELGANPNQLTLQLYGPPNAPFTLQSSSDLRNWSPISPGTFSDQGTATLLQTIPAFPFHRYYRAISR